MKAAGSYLRCCLASRLRQRKFHARKPTSKPTSFIPRETVSGTAHNLGQALLSREGIDCDRLYETKIAGASP